MPRVASYNPANLTSNLRQLFEGQLTTIEVTTPLITGNLARIQHDLGRIPNGYIIVKGPYMSYAHGWNLSDTGWDSTYMYLRFSLSNTPLTIAVF